VVRSLVINLVIVRVGGGLTGWVPAGYVTLSRAKNSARTFSVRVPDAALERNTPESRRNLENSLNKLNTLPV
jgi:hypothetical protein